jgi:uncharacterized membrane protein YcfT
MAAETRRTAWVDAARGIAIVLVVLLHARDWLRSAGVDVHVWKPVIEVMNGLRMPVFFALSGMLGTRWLRAGWRELVADKVIFLAWVYLVWQTIGSLTELLASRITGGHLSVTRMIASLAVTPVRPRFELWFLWVLIVFFVVARASVQVRAPLWLQLAVATVFSAVFLSDLVREGNLGWQGGPSRQPGDLRVDRLEPPTLTAQDPQREAGEPGG